MTQNARRQVCFEDSSECEESIIVWLSDKINEDHYREIKMLHELEASIQKHMSLNDTYMYLKINGDDIYIVSVSFPLKQIGGATIQTTSKIIEHTHDMKIFIENDSTFLYLTGDKKKIITNIGSLRVHFSKEGVRLK